MTSTIDELSGGYDIISSEYLLRAMPIEKILFRAPEVLNWLNVVANRSRLAMLGGSPKAIQELARHQSLMTTQRYIGRAQAAKR